MSRASESFLSSAVRHVSHFPGRDDDGRRWREPGWKGIETCDVAQNIDQQCMCGV
jgi:hypothetical protein